MSALQFRLAARTDAAGKYNADAPLEGNEDNMFIDSDLSNEKQSVFTGDAIVDLSDIGCLMVIADGMGGMNAGEVASAIAINTVTEYFHPDRLTEKEYKDTKSRIRYMEEVVVAADAAIKADSSTNSEHEGMGSTIILAWLCGEEICLTWCGDSRAYLYRPSVGLYQVSKDHSYVQGLLDEGKINEIEAFEHPYGNIITRSLGDPEKKAKPDSKSFKVYKGDIFMLCSDGLSGVLRDRKTYDKGVRIDTENLEDIISENRSTMLGCRDALFEAAKRNEWYDNVTAILCEIVEGKEAPPKPSQDLDSIIAPTSGGSSKYSKSNIVISKKTLPFLILGIVLLLGIAGLLIWKFTRPEPMTESEFWAACQKNENVADYRAYLEKYPDGEFVTIANNWIDKWVNDSIAKEKRKMDSIAKVQKEVILNDETLTENPNPNPNKNNNTPKQNPNDENPVIVEEPGLEEPEPAFGLNPAQPRKIAPVKQPVVYKSPEELAYEKAMSEEAVMEDCVEYLKQFPTGDSFNEVKNRFNVCIFKELRNCKKKQEVENVVLRYKKCRSVVGIREGGTLDNRFLKEAHDLLVSLAE